MPDQHEIEKQNCGLAARLVEEMDRGNFDIFDEVFAEDYACHIPGALIPLTREQYRDSIASIYSAIPDLKHTVEDIFASGDKVTMRSTITGTHRGELNGIPPSGNPVKYSIINISRIVDGRFLETWAVADMLGLMMQIGMQLKSAKEEFDHMAELESLRARLGP